MYLSSNNITHLKLQISMNMIVHNRVTFIFFGLIIPSYCLNLQGLKTSENYGPYAMDWHSYSICIGPKAVNLTQQQFYLDKNGGICTFNITFLEEAKIEEVRVTVLSENDDGIKSTLWNYRIKDPCKHFIVANIIKPYFKTDNCVVKKGFYSYQINFIETGKIFLGTSFFYGTFIFKTIVTSKAGNIHCFETKVLFSKRS